MAPESPRNSFPPAPRISRPGWRSLTERRFVAWSIAATAGSLLAFGIVTAIIPNPVFWRPIPPDSFAIAVWLASAPLMGLILATYLVPPPAVEVALGSRTPGLPAPDTAAAVAPVPDGSRSVLAYAGGLAAFLAIGCPVCNKIVLVLLGTSGALTLWAPLQPLIGAASLVLLAATLAWRLRARARGGTCTVA
jgi:hypothetical protein